MLSGAAIAYQEIRLAAAAISLETINSQPLDLSGIAFDGIYCRTVKSIPDNRHSL